MMQDYPGSGSPTSPILISDDDEQMVTVSGKLTKGEFSAHSPKFNATFSQYSGHGRVSRTGHQVVEKRDFTGRNRQVDEEALKTRKRKREQYDLPHNIAGPSHMHSLPPPPLSVTKSKRARQQERITRWQRDEVARRQVFDDAAFDPESSSFNSDSFSPPHPPDTYLPPAHMSGYPHVKTSSLSSSEWVNSMAKAADPPETQNLIPIPWDIFVPPTPWTSQPVPDLHSVPSWPLQSVTISPIILPPKPVHAAIPTSSSNINASTESPKKPPPTNTIGMPYSRDPDGKRGGFKPSSTTVFESKSHLTFPHRADPSRSLIMDQLPKLSRTPQWLKSWAIDVCGTEPVFIAIDSSSAKALLEFSSVNHAEKAWSSPKLGKGLNSLGPIELKGKARVDLIRVWWYRSSSPELVFTRKELEEGEIEDDESMVDGRKESKKEKRARLAKQAKDEKKKDSLLQSRGLQIKTLSSNSSSMDSPVIHIPASNTSSLPLSPSPASALPPKPFASTTYAPSMAPPVPLLMSPPTSLSAHKESTVKPTIRLESIALPGDAVRGSQHAHRYTKHVDNAVDIDTPFPAVDYTDDIGMELSSPVVQPCPPILHDPQVVKTENHSDDHHATVMKIVVTSNREDIKTESTRPLGAPKISASNLTHLDYTSSESPTVPSDSNTIQTSSVRSSVVQRSLRARQKELEERIARSKLEIERNQSLAGKEDDSTMRSPINQTLTIASTSASSPSISVKSPLPSPNSDAPSLPHKQAIEVQLRRLVLASQRKKKISDSGSILPLSPCSDTTIDNDEHFPTNSGLVVVSEAASSDSNSGTRISSTAAGAMFDDLAVSFIQESIQTTKPTPALPAVAAKPQSNSSSVELAARREQLEYQIVETKRLMELLSQTRTKQGKDTIMAQIRELSRSQKQASLPPTSSFVHTPAYPSFLVKPIEPAKPLWPESIPDGGIFIMSDEEDEDDD
ncbi:hypothetical protein EV368DRAFT_60455 [Lentinula lateritia]|nr:hypothetical protein EV368DRAFT_60455 [Lentinula lateritia]